MLVEGKYGPDKLVTLDCSHVFHKECLSKVIGRLCPLCRAPMTYGKEIVESQIFPELLSIPLPQSRQ